MLTRRTTQITLPKGGPLLVFGGPYSNLQATQAMRAQATALGIPPERCICTGDVVAYGAHPSETVQEIRDWGCHVIAGNVERQLAENALDCGCGFESGTTCDLLSAGWYAHANAQTTPEDRAWMATLPDLLCIDTQWGPIWITHGGTSEVNRFLWPTTPTKTLSAEIAHLPTKPAYVFAGHSGIPFQTQVGQTLWINAGVIGMPPHDGKPQTRYTLLHETGQTEIRTLIYDHQTAAAAMTQANLTQGYHTALTTGHWPSEDILPGALRR
ncbi:metallophosphoesterase family protein [Tropicibacter naphthalenivorans]|uniref:Calcineurin-like phosphoesterase superfamily domain protein n=1 Tax=Tropicibacter naphthalenivorans TaxID=441103 RepID=A0A0P1G6D6_9RHOB|nr:metallophosphoesterase family protein [Tropicibacter naphthalenivorans]CUH77134.1 Calcineurin-like phosphoesterase superfamily domain protein [Tropicibacter naphthalenivorans]SMC60488.1 Calcineurin-like phosphoesterase superfamily domain-containing protein [Tropicibacter naphthalenivorans]